MNTLLPPAGPAPAPCAPVAVPAVGLPRSGRGATLVRILADAPDGLTRQEILERWPAGQRRPGEITLWRWLARAMEYRHVTRTGTGQRGEPFVYRLAAPEATPVTGTRP